MTTLTANIVVDRLPVLETKIAKMDRKARKLGLQPPILAIGEYYLDTHRHPVTGRKIKTPMVSVTVENPDFKIEGYSFLCALDHPREKGGENIIRALSDGEYSQYRFAGPDCTHCGKTLYRKNTYILEKDSGTHVQVGSTCIRDFLGQSAENALASAQYLAELPEMFDDEDWHRPCPEKPGLVEALAAADRSIVNRGYQASHAEYPTRDDVGIILVNQNSPACPAEHIITPENVVRAETVLAHFRGKTPEETQGNSYMDNLRVIANRGYYDDKQLGFVVSMVSTYDREQGKLAQAKLRAEKALTAEYVGTVGEILDTEVTLIQVISWETCYGVTRLHLFEDDKGNPICWKTAKYLPFNNGDTLKIRGRVKSQEAYKGMPQTMLTRCKVTPISESASA